MSTASDAEWGLLGDGDRLLGIYGAEDTMPSPADVDAFSKRCDERGIEKEIKIYDGVGHAFVSKRTFDDGGRAKEAWEQILAYFDKLPARRLQQA